IEKTEALEPARVLARRKSQRGGRRGRHDAAGGAGSLDVERDKAPQVRRQRLGRRDTPPERQVAAADEQAHFVGALGPNDGTAVAPDVDAAEVLDARMRTHVERRQRNRSGEQRLERERGSEPSGHRAAAPSVTPPCARPNDARTTLPAAAPARITEPAIAACATVAMGN